MSKAWWIVIGVAVGLVALGGPFFVAVSNTEEPDHNIPPLDLASTTSSDYLKSYIDANGMVKRSNSSETQAQAQAWALLVAAATNDSQRFAKILDWTNSNLRQSNGSYVPPDSAASSHGAEVDLDVAWALATAGKRLSNSAYVSQAKDVATALFANRQVAAGNESMLFSGGPNPNQSVDVQLGDVFQRALQQVAPVAPDLKWTAVESGHRSATVAATGAGAVLPAGPIKVLPNGTVGAQLDNDGYTQGNQAVPLILATSCNAADTNLNTQLWQKLRESRETRVAKAMTIRGKVTDSTPWVRAAVASAAAARSAGEELQTTQLLQDADGIQKQKPTSEGAAWDALGRILLTTDWLGGCN